MNRSNFEHAGYAVLMMLGVWALTHNAVAGACFGGAFFLGREHAQAQRNYGLGDLQAFMFWKWSLDAQLDLLFPVLSCIAVYFILRVF